MNPHEVFLRIRKSFTFHDPKPILSRALILLIITVFLASPQIGMGFSQLDVVVLILIIAIAYHVFIGLFALARQDSIEAFPTQQIIDSEESDGNIAMSSVDEEIDERLLRWVVRVLCDLKKVSPQVPAYSKLTVLHLSILMRLDKREEGVEAEYDGPRRYLVELGLVSSCGRLRPNGVRLARHLRKLGHADLLRLWTKNGRQAIQLITNSQSLQK